MRRLRKQLKMGLSKKFLKNTDLKILRNTHTPQMPTNILRQALRTQWLLGTPDKPLIATAPL
jgi:hypothetical protein